MVYTDRDVLGYIEEEDVKFIRLAFCDVYGNQKNIAIMASELEHALREGVIIDSSAIHGFYGDDGDVSELLLVPIPSTLSVLPWRPSNGRVIRLFCDICTPDGKHFDGDCRYLLRHAADECNKHGIICNFGAESEFYLMKADENGQPTNIPYDNAGYMDIAPLDRGENVRREICLSLEEMGIRPESSHHEKDPGQNEIDFKCSDALSAADNVITYRGAVRTIAAANGLYAAFGPRPIENQSGNGMHINVSLMLSPNCGSDSAEAFAAGILGHMDEMTVFLNPTNESYERIKNFNTDIMWSPDRKKCPLRIRRINNEYGRFELRFPDNGANPYLAYALIIYAGLDGIEKNLKLPEANTVSGDRKIPISLEQAKKVAGQSAFIRSKIASGILKAYEII